jgi:hypothetical protein
VLLVCAETSLAIGLIEDQAWQVEFLHKVDLKILLIKTGSNLNFKIALISLHIDPALKLAK